MERCGVDKVVIDGVLHWEHLAQREIDGQRDGTCAQLGDDVILGGEEDTVRQKGSVQVKLTVLYSKK